MPLRRLRAPLLVLLASLAPLGMAPAAHAALGTRACGDAGALRCGTLDVPLDRSGATGGVVGLAYARRPASAATDQAVVPLAGGPGQAALPFAADFGESLKALLPGRDLVVFDQRGTGSSGPLDCFGSGGPSSEAQVRACATTLGPARNFYRSIDSAEDIEALRIAGGYRKLVLYGVSYGTRVALTYAARYPDRVAGLVLDSVVPLEGPDIWSRPSFGALSRVLRQLCAGDACRLATPNPNADLRAFVSRLQRGDLRGSVTGPGGGRVGVRLTAVGLWQTLLAGDLNPTLRAELPGAVRAALRGDRTPILRLRARAAGLNGSVPASGRAGLQAAGDDVNTTLFTATRCSETAFPWNAASSSGDRVEEASASLNNVPASAFTPFGRGVPLTQSILDLCSSWPDSPLPAPAAAALPAVPTLVLEGAGDLRTPVEQGRRVASAIPGARFVTVANTGHSTLGSDLSGCVDAELAAFAAGTASTCTAKANPIAPTPRPPLSLSVLAGGTRALRTVSAVRATLNDVRRQLIGDAIASGRSVTTGARTGGLRGGVARVNGDVVELDRVVYVPGVRVSGSYAIKRGSTSDLQVTGPRAARGRLSIDGSGTARGTLGGRRVEAAAAASAASAAGVAWGRGLDLPPFAHPALRPAG